MKTATAIFIAACVFPLIMNAADQQFYIGFGARVLIYAMAAASRTSTT